MLQTLILLFGVHFIGDFGFQSAWMAMEKGKSWEVLFYHVSTYTSCFSLLLLVPQVPMTMLGLFSIFITHFAIDTLSARLKIVKTIWLDQLLHLSVLVGITILGWV